MKSPEETQAHLHFLSGSTAAFDSEQSSALEKDSQEQKGRTNVQDALAVSASWILMDSDPIVSTGSSLHTEKQPSPLHPSYGDVVLEL